MKRLIALAVLFALPLLIACGGGGGLFSPDEAADPFGYRFSAITAANTPTLTNADVRTVLLAKTGTFAVNETGFAGTADGLFSFDPQAETVVFSRITDAALANQSINSLLQESSGDLLIGTDNGLYRRLTNGSISAVSPQLAGKRVLCIAEQSSGTVWVGLEDVTAATNSAARSKDNGSTFTFWGSDKGLTASSVVSLSVDATKVYACGLGDLGNAGVFQFQEAMDKFVPNGDIPLGSGATLLVRVGSTWVVSGPNSGVFLSTDSGINWTRQLADVTAYAFGQSQSGQFSYSWLATDKGVYATMDLANGWTTKFDKTNRLSLDNCHGFTTSRSGSLWVSNPGAAGGIARGFFVGD